MSSFFSKCAKIFVKMGTPTIEIVKASGVSVAYQRDKLERSLWRVSKNAAVVQQVLDEVEKRLHPGISTRKIYSIAFKALKKLSRGSAPRYHLKRGILELGPSGFPFEKYVAELLKLQGYRTEAGIFVQGKCVTHEVDVMADNNRQLLMVECKHHSQPGAVCDVKVPLYIQSRFMDVEDTWAKIEEYKKKHHQGCVITNAKFSVDAIKYGSCIGLELIGWGYPEKNSLNELADRLRLYPVTSLTTLNRREKQHLLDRKVILCRELDGKVDIIRSAGVTGARIEKVLEEVRELCEESEVVSENKYEPVI